MLTKSFIEFLYEAAYIQRWNDHIRPGGFTELDKQAHKMMILYVLARLLSSQLITNGEKHLLDRSRTYYRLLRRIAQAGQAAGELSTALSAGGIVKLYALAERALLYDWCLCGGEYSLREYAEKTLPGMLSQLLPEKNV